MRFVLVFVAALLLVVPATALATSGQAPELAMVAKAKAGTCKGGTVPVTVGTKTTCKPLAKAIPKPEAIDIRLGQLQEVLKFDPAKAVTGRKRKRVRTLQSGFGAAGKKAQKKLLRALPKALAFIDGRGGARSSLLGPGPALASSGCDVGPAGPTGHAGGASVGALGDNGGYIDASAGGGLRVRVTFVSCRGPNNFRIPDCPTANGVVDATGTGEFRATVEIWNGDRLVSRNSSTFEGRAKTHGEVGPDAKLKFIDVEHTQEVFIVTGGIVIRGGVTRKVRIDMPGGGYDPAGASVRYFGDSIASNSGASDFASTAASALSAYQGAEPRWSTFNPSGGYCAEPVFTPDSNTLKLKKDDKKQLGIYAKARQDGGRATAARWTLLNPLNANFSPTSSQDPTANISYTVTSAPKGGEVKVTVKFTSTAGVGEKAWVQPTEESTGKLIGNFSGEIVTPTLAGPSVQSWNGGATLERTTPDLLGGPNGAYALTAGTVTYHLSGIEALISACQWSGTAVVSLPSGGGSGSAGVFGTPPEFTAPYEYNVKTVTPPPPQSQVTFTRHDCPPGADELEGTEETIPFGVDFETGQQKSVDGLVYAGSTEKEEGGVSFKQSWVFEAKP
jgi:hypothetical protein